MVFNAFVCLLFYGCSIFASQVPSTDSGQLQLYKAITNNSAAEIRTAVAAGADVNGLIYGQTPLCIAVVQDRYESFKCLLELGAQCDAESNLALMEALESSSPYALALIDPASFALLAGYGAKKFSHLCQIMLEEGLIGNLDFEGILLIMKKFPHFAAEIKKMAFYNGISY